MTLSAENLVVHMPGFDLLREINLAVAPGEVVAIVGPNGAGKSSLLKAMTGELRLASGHVQLNGRLLKDWPLEQRARVLAVLSQHSDLNFPFTAEEVVSLGRIPHDTGVRHDQEIVEQALHRVDGDYLQTRSFVHMSGGEKQRVQLARVLAQIWEPSEQGDRFILLDEPTAAFDLLHQQMTLNIVSDMAANGVGVLMVLHDLNLAAKCADKLVVLTCGSIAAQGRPADILTEALVNDVFGVACTISRHPATGAPMVIT